MIFLLAAIVIHTYIFLCFRLFKKFEIHTFSTVVINYATCAATGLVYNYMHDLSLDYGMVWEWGHWSFLLGIVLVSTFHVMALNTQKNGMSTAAIAAKTSMIIPIIYSLFFVYSSSISLTKGLGILAAFGAIFLSSKKDAASAANAKNWLLIMGTFIGAGLVDLIINVTGHRYHSANFENQFSILSFGFAAFTGTIYALSQRFPLLEGKNVLAGIVLGVPNYFSILFIYKALQSFAHNGAFVFPSLNIGTIVLAAFLSLFVFKEPMSQRNYWGLGAAVLGLCLLMV